MTDRQTKKVCVYTFYMYMSTCTRRREAAIMQFYISIPYVPGFPMQSEPVGFQWIKINKSCVTAALFLSSWTLFCIPLSLLKYLARSVSITAIGTGMFPGTMILGLEVWL